MRRKKYSNFYILKNALKATLRNKVQIIGLILLIALTATIFTLMQTTSQRVYNSYNNFINESNLHDFIIDLRKVKPNENKIKHTNDIDDISYAQLALKEIEENMLKEKKSSFKYEYREGRIIFRASNTEENLFKVLVYDNESNIDKLILLDENSEYIKNSYEAIISPEFAKKNNYKIGDIICLQSIICDEDQDVNNPLTIVGLGSSADYMYPQIDLTTPIPNQKRESLIYVHPKQFGLEFNKEEKKWVYFKSKEKITLTSNQDKEVYFVCKWINETGDIDYLQKELKKYFYNIQAENQQIVFNNNDKKYDFYSRVNNINMILKAYKITTISLLIMAVIISGFVIILVTKKRVENSQAQIGILKSIGYSSISITSGFLMYPFIASVIGGFIGYFLGLVLQIPIINVFNWYFTINFGSFNFNIISLLFSILLMFILLGTITFFSSFWYVKGPPLRILRSQENKKSIFLTKMFTYLNREKSFSVRFRWAIFAKSFSKMITVSITMIAATMLLTLSITGPKALEDMRNSNYKGINYNSLTEYEIPVWNSPLSTYAVYNLEYNKTNKGNNSKMFSPKLMQEVSVKNEKRYRPSFETLISLSTLHYTLFDWEFYLNASLTKLEPSNKINNLKSITCNGAMDDWQEKSNEEKEKWTLSDCIIYGTTKRSPYFVRSKLINLQLILNKIETKTAEKVLEEKDLVRHENKKNWLLEKEKGLSLEDNEKFLQQIKDDKDDENYQKRYEVTLQVFNEIKKLLNNVENNNYEDNDLNWNRYLETFISYRDEVIKKLNISEVFNIQFGLLTYNSEQDELSTYFKPEVKKINGKSVENSYKISNFKAYGIQRKSRMHSLLDSNSNDLLEAMYENYDDSEQIPVIINQTLAKHWQINQGDILELKPNRPTLYANNKELEIDDWKIDGKIFNASHDKIADGSALYFAIGSSTTEMYNQIKNGTVFIKNSEELKNFKVIGIQEGYGDARMFLTKDSADELMGYREKNESLEGSSYFKKICDIFNAITDIKREDLEKLKNMFPNVNNYDEAVREVFPIFNAKFSFNRNIKDITSGISITQLHGDFNPLTLNGSGKGKDQVIGLGHGAISYALPIAVHQSVFDEIKGIADAILYAFMAISLLISFIIILLTSNIIINENNRLISTMKVIGYNDYEINWLTLGMYLPVILVSFIIGFPIAWFAMSKLVNYLALNTTWVMPFYFSWWLIFTVLFIVLIIYSITFIIGWMILKRVNALDLLKIND